MKRIAITFLLGFLAQRMLQAQGTIYLSNLDQPSSGGQTVSSNRYWLAQGFYTGANDGGYSLNSIQLAMLDAVGNSAGGFSVMIYASDGQGPAIAPGTWLAALNGSTNPSTAGVYTYTPSSSFTLSPDTGYFIVLAAETSFQNGYAWSYIGSNSGNSTDDWGTILGIEILNNGVWTGPSLIRYGQFAISATPVPEPSQAWLLLAGGGVFFYVRKLRST